ncbi:hypothetical protein ETD86_32660 [Nonomuraea turkmeniaca]|uniref:Uncharacterized protein n=1 Tax=Nonomuraea turkmeniaca TaxID=103838 RepID=A0A5S4F7X8_9ACTN|nr:hypothetical protein [Nonomuraea turkmeniaca]TMR12403.1 hypothetical protein ETD86_32660 [Nonomuraea turkmeniaca]
MQKIAWRAMRVGVITLAVTAIGLANALPVSALTWYGDPPTKASNLVTMGAVGSLSCGGTVMVRRGNHGNYAYYCGAGLVPKFDLQQRIYPWSSAYSARNAL